MEVTTLFFSSLLFQFRLISANYEYICTEKLLVKPYLNIYNTRLGDTVLEEGPGFYEVGDLTNIYVCTNGPVVLYFTRYTSNGDVYDDAINTIDIHKCQYYNGEQGPGAYKQADHLRAILLFGDERDYRLPSIKTFTAPLLMDPNSGIYQNVTSLITVGAYSCEIFKEPYKQSITFNMELTGEMGVCRLPYQMIDKWVKEPAGATTLKDLTKEVLKNDYGMVEGGCTKKMPHGSIKVAEFKNKDKEMSDLIAKVTAILPVPVPKATEIGTKKGEIDSTNTSISTATDPALILNFKTELAKKENELAALEAEQLLFEVYTKLQDIKTNNKFSDTISTLDACKDPVSRMEGLLEDKRKLDEEYLNLVPSDRVSINRITLAQSGLDLQLSTLTSTITGCFDSAAPGMKSSEESLKRMKSLLEIFPLVQEVVDANTALISGSKSNSAKIDGLKTRSLSVAETIDVDLSGTDPVEIPIRTATGLVEIQDICLAFPEIGTMHYRIEDGVTLGATKGTCYSEKGTKLFGCQMLKARLGEPGICALREEDADNEKNPSVPVPDALPATAYLPQHMVDVLNLINEIYKKACDRIRPVFAERVNNLLQCYLIKDRIGKSQTSADGTSPNRVNFWNKIIIALQECRDEGHALKFVRESPEVDKYYLKKNGDFLEVPFLKEQAEYEYGFNFAIDMSWKVFATVLGLCMPSYESKIPLITTRFFTLFTEEFLQPIQEIWISEKDNNIFLKIMSYYYGVGGYETWATYCMEASFLYSSDVSYRPPRKLPVNGRSESNYFVKNKLKKKKRK